MNLALFEDPLHENFEPISLSRPASMFLYGTSKIYEKWIQALKPKACYFLCRDYLAEVLTLETGLKHNIIPRGDNLFINGRFIPSADSLVALRKLNPGECALVDDELLAFRLIASRRLPFEKHLLRLHEPDSYNRVRSLFRKKKTKAAAINRLWDMIDNNGEMISAEFPEINRKLRVWGKVDPKATIIKKNSVVIMPGAVIGPQVTIDASKGPVIVDNNVIVEPLTYIKGPAYIGPGSRLVGGKIREGCSFGPTCRIGGEVEETIMLGYDNKYHDGFLGHAYLGEWINLGAMTTNSDLKNNYSEISVVVNDRPVGTGKIKVGCFVGDHTKTGIGTLLNTGISIGFSCNLFGGSLFTEKIIKSFSWGTPGNLVEYKVEKAVQTAADSMKRRNVEFTPSHEKLFNEIYKASGWSAPVRKARRSSSRS
jgi:UDP-N-acetylglucosamine diphosphorylase/glucosamine-1-phosphate N-acetyltransferase